ncbi:MAG TPA: carbohydrate binding domain-containing protein [Opitutaceae bacterium]
MSPRPLPRLLASIVLLALSSAPVRALNLITNDTFISDTAPWSLQLSSGCVATLAPDNGWGRVSINSGGSSKSSVNLQHTLRDTLVNGVTYTIAFDVRADAAKSIDAVVRNVSGAVLGGFYGIAVTTTPTRHTFIYTHTQPDTVDARLAFRIGGDTIAVAIDNVVFTRQGSPSQLLTQNPDGTWTFNTLTVGGKTWNAGAYDFSYAGYQYGEREAFIDIPAATQTISAISGENITDKVNAALAALPAGGTVLIPAGTFRIGAGSLAYSIDVTTDNTVIKGAGMGVTILQVDPAYHASTTVSSRQTATFSTGVINFFKPNSSSWRHGGTTTTATATVPLGARSITVADASAFSVGDIIVIRQVMWQSFVQAYAYNEALAPKALRWTNYDAGNTPLFSNKSYSFCYYRRILAKSGNTISLDVPVPHALNPANMPVSVAPLHVASLRNCGLQDLTFSAGPENDAASEKSLGTTVMIKGLAHGLFKNVDIDSFRSLGFATEYPVNISFLNCSASNAIHCGTGGAGYGFYLRGQNLLLKNCTAINVRHGYTTAAPQTSNVVIKNCTSLDYRFNSDITSGESVDDTHLQFAHGVLWDNHYAKDAGLLMINRGTLSTDAYETCGWSIVWNYENEGYNTKSSTNNDLRHNLLGVTPAEFGIVVGAHAGNGPAGIRVNDGYARWPATTWGTAVTTPVLHVGPTANRVLFELTGSPVAESLYDIQFAQRAKLLSSSGEIVVDNADSAHVVSTGAWTLSTSSPGYLDSNYAHDGNVDKGTKTFSFKPAIPSAGVYLVYARWTAAANRASNVPVDIIKADGSVSTVTVNQQNNNNTWTLLGVFPLSPANAEVKIRTTGTNGYVIADGVRLAPQ